MQPTPALAAWLGDAEAQAASADRARAFAARPSPRALADFGTSVAAAGEDSATRVAATRALFADPRWAEELVAGLIAEAEVDPFFLPPLRQLHHFAHDGLLLFDGETVSVGLLALSPDSLAAHKVAAGGRGTIGCSGMLALYRVLAGTARLSLWSAPRIGGDFAAADDPCCRRAGERDLAAGDWLLVDGRAESFVVEAMPEPLVLLQAMIAADRASLAVDYDANTGALAGATAADPAASHRQMMASLLRALGRSDATPVLERETRDGACFVRWHALREWLALDPSGALPRLREMAANDPHHDVRSAAVRTLAAAEARACRG